MQTEVKKCTTCRTHKGKRYCLRNNKHICWLCCNDLRVDAKCPLTCDYNKTDSSKPKTDSLAEYYDYIDKHTKLWITKQNEDFDNQIPLRMKETETGRKELAEKLSKTKLDYKVAKIYEKHLSINLNSKDIAYNVSFEDIGFDFLHAMGDEKWHLIPNFFSHKDPITVSKYITRLKQKKEIKGMNYLTVMASGISTDGHSAFSSFEINYKSDISLLYVNIKNEWKIDNVIFGEINLIYSETDTIKHIANYLAQKEYERAFLLIKQAEEIYYLSPDILYNKGMYFSLKGQLNDALKAFAEAAELDVEFAEPIYNQAFIYQTENKLEEAKRLYEKTLTLQKNNVNALNNLGTIYLQEKDYGNAKYYFEECLKYNPEFQYAVDNLKLVQGLDTQ